MAFDLVVTASTSAQELDAQVGLVVGDRERRREAQRGLAGGADEQVVLERRVRDRAGRAVELDGEQQAGAADVAEAAASKRSPIARTWASSSSSIVSTTAQAAAQATGLPPKVEAWSPGTKPVGASSATSSAPIGSPFASPFASVTRVGPHAVALPGEELAACGRRRSAPRRRSSSAPCSSASARASSSVSARERMHAALAQHRLEEDRGRVGADARRASVSGVANRDARDERLERRRASPAGR